MPSYRIRAKLETFVENPQFQQYGQNNGQKVLICREKLKVKEQQYFED